MKTERICVVYGSREKMQDFLNREVWGRGMLGDNRRIRLLEIRPGSAWFKEIRHALLKRL